MKILNIVGIVVLVFSLAPRTPNKELRYEAWHTANTLDILKREEPSAPPTKADDIPASDTSFKTWMPYTAITNTASLQYKLQENAQTDEHGLRIYDDRYMVAVGTPYGDVGDKITVTLDTGRKLYCVIGDSKGDRHYHAVYNTNHEFVSANVLEFIVDRNMLDQDAKESGDISSIENFEGEVISIERL